MTIRADRLRIFVLGQFRVETEGGQDLTPKGAKNQALLALLALSPHMTQTRRWLEDKLWSTFGAEQASANLRQALSKVRAGLRADADILTADRSSVTLDSTRIIVDLHDKVVPKDSRSELLQGMDVRDPEFEEWLRVERAQLRQLVESSTPGEAKGLLINCRAEDPTGDLSSTLGDMLANNIGENIAEQVRAWRQSLNSTEPDSLAPQSDLTVQTHLVATGAEFAVFVKVLHQPSARILYSKLLNVGRLEEVLTTSELVGRTIFEAADNVIGKLPLVLENARPEARATALSRLALYRMFSFEADALREARGLMNQAFEHDPNGIYLAWSSMIRMVQLMESSASNQAELLEEAVELQYRAMDLAADNPLVHAIVSKVRSTAFGEISGPLDSAKTAVERNPASAYAWKSLADAELLAGNLDKAFAASHRACRLAHSSPFRHWWDTGHCIIAIACKRMDEAIDAGESAARSAPLSRPALRHLLALYALQGQMDKAQEIARKLAKIEPGFTLDRFVNDENYPVRTLRTQGLLEPVRALL